MKKEKISKVIGEIAEHHIEEALNYDQKQYPHFGHWKTFQKAAACIALIIIGLVGTTGIAFAASKDFRNVVIHLFGFTKEEKKEIENGHMTGKLDKIDTLLTFLDEFNNKNMEKVKYNNGYEYKFLEENNGHVDVIVVCESDKYRLLVSMKQESIAEGVMGWYAASYQMISSEQAEELIMSSTQNPENTEKTEEEQDDVDHNANDNVLKADKEHAKICNGLHKEEENIISLTKKETQDMIELFESYEHDDNTVWGDGLNKFFILFDKSKYYMTESGYVLGEKEGEGKHISFKLTKKDLEKVMSLFHKYGIPD